VYTHTVHQHAHAQLHTRKHIRITLFGMRAQEDIVCLCTRSFCDQIALAFPPRSVRFSPAMLTNSEHHAPDVSAAISPRPWRCNGQSSELPRRCTFFKSLSEAFLSITGNLAVRADGIQMVNNISTQITPHTTTASAVLEKREQIAHHVPGCAAAISSRPSCHSDQSSELPTVQPLGGAFCNMTGVPHVPADGGQVANSSMPQAHVISGACADRCV